VLSAFALAAAVSCVAHVARAQPLDSAASTEWPTYGGNLASHHYSPLDQINAENFKNLEIAWRFRTDSLGPRPDRLYSATPLYVNGLLYTTAGQRRAAVALDPATGELIWMHREDEGARGESAIRQGAGRGVSYWQSPDGSDRRIIYVTPGYRLLALDAKTGIPIESFGRDGVVDLRLDFDQNIDLIDSNVGLNATPLIVGDVIVVGAAHRPAGSMASKWDVRGYVRGFDVRTGKRLWTFHTIPQRGEFGYDTWENGSADRNGNAGVWAQMSADPELGLVYLPVEMPTADYNGFNRPGDGLFEESLVAVDVRTGERRWHFQTVHHGVWDYDLPCAPILFDMQMDGRTIKALAQPTKSAFLFVLNRETGEPIWPIEERPVPQSESPYEKTSPTQPFPTWPEPFDRQGISIDDLNDLTPELHAEAEKVVEQYRLGPLFTPPALEKPGGPIATLMLPSDVGGANWPGGAFDPETHRLYIHSHTAVFALPNIPADLKPFDPSPGAQAGDAGDAARPPPGLGVGPGRGPGSGPGALGPRGGPGLGTRRAGTFLQGTIPLIKPPYDRITAYDMNDGRMLWQKPHGTTQDNIRNNPALAGLDVSRLGAYGRIFIGVLVTKTLLIAGEGSVHTNEAGETVALLRAYDKATGEDVDGQVEMPARQTGSPMTYIHDGKQYIVLAVSHTGADAGGEVIAYALP
jgi:quinoprotein glucose dehydrogenase